MADNTQPPRFRHTWTNLPEPDCSHDTLEPNGHRPPAYQPVRCAKCKRPLTPEEVFQGGKVTLNATGPFQSRVTGTIPLDTGDIDPILNKLEDDGLTH